MDLTAAMLLINSTLKCLHHSRKEEEYCKIAEDSKQALQALSSIGTGTVRNRHEQFPSIKLADDCFSRDPDILYYEVIDRFIGELEARFGESREVLSAVAACSSKANDFFKL